VSKDHGYPTLANVAKRVACGHSLETCFNLLDSFKLLFSFDFNHYPLKRVGLIAQDRQVRASCSLIKRQTMVTIDRQH